MDYSIKPLDNQRPSGVSLVPRLPFTSYIVAQKGSGKTVLWLNLLTRPEFLKGKFNRILVFSPTAKLDEKTNVLKETDGIISPNSKLIKLLGKLQKNNILSYPAEINSNNADTSLADADFKEEVDLEELQEIVKEQKFIIQNYGKSFADKILLVFDDCISSKILNSRAFKQLVFNSRHVNISMIIISQSYYQLDKSIRLNNSHLILFENGNKKEIQSIYEENNSGLSFNQFYDIYRDCVDIPFGFLVVNYQNPKKYRLQNQFLQIFQ